ncbi:hypothetical protein Daesc_006514 [Daldinia eschscholtzii]|uniref:C2H2-type domain-containing protein n=1 Tax=Daldinia eschscholtzii TaxID=292717 RepID=A0AAX6MH05_9PEZI
MNGNEESWKKGLDMIKCPEASMVDARRTAAVNKFTGHSCPPYLSGVRDLAVAPNFESPWTKSTGSGPDLQELAPYIQNGSRQSIWNAIWDPDAPHSHFHSCDDPQLDQNEVESCETNHNSSGNSQDALQQSSSSNDQGNSGRQPGKRNNNGDHPDRRDQKRRSTAPTLGQKKSQQKFACPFYRYDPWRYFGCVNYGLHRIGDVRQHVFRRHAPVIHCPRCGLIFEGEQTNEKRDQHIRERACAEQSFDLPGITEERLDAMRNAASGSSVRNDEEKWYEIWVSLFPGIQRPPPEDVYLGPGFCVPAHFIGEYQSQNRLPVQRLITVFTRGPFTGENAHELLGALFDDMSLYIRLRMDVYTHNSQVNEHMARDTQSPILSSGSMSLPMPPYEPTLQQDLVMDPENQMVSIQMDENLDVGSYLYSSAWQQSPGWSNE